MRADIFISHQDIDDAGSGLVAALSNGSITLTLGKYRESLTLFLDSEDAKTIANRILDALRGDDEVEESVVPNGEMCDYGDRQVWYLNGQRHRTDGPAYVDGDYQEWLLNGQLHRTDGPAIVNGDYQAWWLNGQRHRTDGPAIVNGDHQSWYLNGVEMTEAEHAAKVAAMTVDEVIA